MNIQTEKQTIDLTVSLHKLFDLREGHANLIGQLESNQEAGDKLLLAIRRAGYAQVQSGSECRTKVNPPKTGYFPYPIVKEELTTRFIAKCEKDKKTYTPKQLADYLKQQIFILNNWLKTGKFSSNVSMTNRREEYKTAMDNLASATHQKELDKQILTITQIKASEARKVVNDTQAQVKKLGLTLKASSDKDIIDTLNGQIAELMMDKIAFEKTAKGLEDLVIKQQKALDGAVEKVIKATGEVIEKEGKLPGKGKGKGKPKAPSAGTDADGKTNHDPSTNKISFKSGIATDAEEEVVEFCEHMFSHLTTRQLMSAFVKLKTELGSVADFATL